MSLGEVRVQKTSNNGENQDDNDETRSGEVVECARQYKLICRNRLKRFNYFMLHQDVVAQSTLYVSMKLSSKYLLYFPGARGGKCVYTCVHMCAHINLITLFVPTVSVWIQQSVESCQKNLCSQTFNG